MSARTLGREKDLTEREVKALLKRAEKYSERDYLFLCLIGHGRGFRVGEAVGNPTRVKRYQAWVDRADHSKGREWRETISELPGIHAEDIRDGAIWVRQKGGSVSKVLLPKWLYNRLAKFTENRQGRIFDFQERQGYKLVQKYAREAGLEDWRLVHPHRLRHYFISRVHRKWKDLPTSQNLARHKSWRTTLRYIAKLTPEEEAEKLEELSATRP